MTVHPLNAAAAVLLDAEVSGRPALVPITGATEPELARLLMLQIEQGSIPAAEYEAASRVLDKSVRQIQRKLAALRDASPHSAAPARQRFELTLHHKQVIFASNGNVALAYEQLVKAGEELPNHDTFWRRWNEQPSGVQAYARKGAEGMVDFWLYAPYTAPERNTVWQADHFELPVDVIADGCTTTRVKPWLTLMVDDRTRKVMSWALTAMPGRRAGAETVCATIAAGIRIRLEQGVEVGGVPGIMRWDNDLSFLAGMVLQMGIGLGFECHAVPPYSGHMKGKIERLGRTVQEQFCVLLPGYTHGTKTWKQKDPQRATERPLTAAQLRAKLDLWFAEYDQRPHSALGMSPLAAWAKETTPLRRATEKQLRPALLIEPKRHKVIKRKGVHFQGQYWQSAELVAITGRNVEVHYPIGSNIDFIEVYFQGHWHCTAWPAVSLTESQLSAMWDGRAEMYAEVRGLQDEATRIREGATAAMGNTDATPAIASMPTVDPLEADVDDFYDLLTKSTKGLVSTGTDGPEPQQDSQGRP
jgi:putative transposase